ncbi:hypothetical protein Tco_0000401 [Tanacetum coccineum]
MSAGVHFLCNLMLYLLFHDLQLGRSFPFGSKFASISGVICDVAMVDHVTWPETCSADPGVVILFHFSFAFLLLELLLVPFFLRSPGLFPRLHRSLSVLRQSPELQPIPLDDSFRAVCFGSDPLVKYPTATIKNLTLPGPVRERAAIHSPI